MSFTDESYGDSDPIRRSVGYFGESAGNLPVAMIPALDRIYERNEVGTDLFVPGFDYVVNGKNDWVNQMIWEILENFLMAIEYNNLNVIIENQEVTKKISGILLLVTRNMPRMHSALIKFCLLTQTKS